MVNLSSEFYVQANVEDTSKIFVHIGLGFHPELTLDEALKFIETKETIMNEYAPEIQLTAFVFPILDG
jgi:prefoldin subunit 5